MRSPLLVLAGLVGVLALSGCTAVLFPVEPAAPAVPLGVAMVGADTWGLEVLPFEKNAGVFEVHQILLPLNGIYILENMHTEEMVKDKA